MFLCVDHVNIVVSDLSRSVDFYTNTLGFQRGSSCILKGAWMDQLTGISNVSAKVVFVHLGEFRFELLQYVSPQGAVIDKNSIPNTVGMRHIAFQVVDFNKTVSDLKEKGVTFLKNSVVFDLKNIGMEGSKRLVYFFDPDNVILEINEYV